LALPEVAQSVNHWIESIEPITNLLRFYEALPVLLLDAPRLSAQNADLLTNSLEDCVLVPGPALTTAVATDSRQRLRGLALPASFLGSDPSNGADFPEALANPGSDETFALATTFEDIPRTADLKQVARVLEVLRTRLAN